jgi:N-carbamoylputrescine amidase
MKVTVCQFQNEAAHIASTWAALLQHVQAQKSELVLLPEMPFHPWLAANPEPDPDAWLTAVESHNQYQDRFAEMGKITLLGSRPVIHGGGQRLNEAFVWQAETGYRLAHLKHYLPNEEGYWEASWYERSDGRFLPIQSDQTNIGFMICTDMWFMQHARDYSEAGIHILAVPRATPHETLAKWLAGGQTAAVISGAYCLSSNLYSAEIGPVNLGGCGWIIDPDGRILASTTPENPFITLEIDLQVAEAAKQTYPRYVKR